MKALEPEWMVEIYRFTDSEGWQKQTEGNLGASARKDCIVIPTLRQKFTLRGGDEKSSVIRRNNCLLLVSRRRTRAMLLKFKSLKDCLEFCDQFSKVNFAPNETTASAQTQEEAIRQQDREGTISYVAQLLHDPDFLSFVGKLESYISSSNDGDKLLKGLEQLDLLSEQNP
eukprot:scaffold1242_cov123-Cylindrotheca_fusiformis.AAC.13